MRCYVGLPLSNWGLNAEIEFRDLPFNDRKEQHVTEWTDYSKKMAYGFDLDRINTIIDEHGAQHGVFFEYSDDYIIDGHSSRHKNLSVFTFSDEDDEPIDLKHFHITNDQMKALQKCAELLLEEGHDIPKIALYTTDGSIGWKQFKRA